MTRLVDALMVPLEPYALDATDVIDGTPEPSEATITSLGDAEIGIWQITPGTVTDVEKDEVFVVLSGEGTITFEDGEILELNAGSLVRLEAGESTVWEIRTTLRKVYIV